MKEMEEPYKDKGPAQFVEAILHFKDALQLH
jgi:hypothetical protein